MPSIFSKNRFLQMVSLYLLSKTSIALSDSYDQYYRLISYPGKVQVPCPIQTKSVGVILVIGQSNSANHAEKKMKSRHRGHVYNYFQGKCYAAKSPLLGATGDGGEFMTPLADYLIDFGVYKDVVIIPSGINGSLIDPWREGGHLNDMLMQVIDNATQQYNITEVIWHQGESDFLNSTPADLYKQSFYSLLSTIRKDEKQIPFYYAVATRCLYSWFKDNPIAQAQKTLLDPKKQVYLGANTDDTVTERIDNNCHFKEPGQIKVAYDFASAIEKNHKIMQ